MPAGRPQAPVEHVARIFNGIGCLRGCLHIFPSETFKSRGFGVQQGTAEEPAQEPEASCVAKLAAVLLASFGATVGTECLLKSNVQWAAVMLTVEQPPSKLI